MIVTHVLFLTLVSFCLATGPVTVETSGTKFVQDIENLYASGGGDCPELTFTGILDAMKAEPEPGSPIYVFTDATARTPQKTI